MCIRDSIYIVGGKIPRCITYGAQHPSPVGIRTEHGCFQQIGCYHRPVSYTHLDVYKRQAETPADIATVVIRLAPVKKRIKNGKLCLTDTLSPFVPSAFRLLNKARASVIGMIASVRVSFTVTACLLYTSP